MLTEIENLHVRGATNDQFNEGGCVIYHVLRKENAIPVDENHKITLNPYACDVFYRSRNCIVLIEGGTISCQECISDDKKSTYKINLKRKNLSEPASKYAPVTKTNPNRLRLTIQEERQTIQKQLLKCGQLEEELQMMCKELNKNTLAIGNSLSDDLISILLNVDQTEVTPFMNLFWQQQKQLFTRSPKGCRYHHMIIRFCLSLASKSKSAYEELRNSNILRLPSTRILVDYKNLIKPGTGFRKEIIDNLCDITKDYSNVERYIVLLFDEMKIRSNLVFNKHTEELIGLLDLGDPQINYNMLEGESKLATYVLCFYLRGISTNLKYSFAHFATSGATATQMFPLFWEAASRLQFNCNLWVIAATSDGASLNRKLFRMLGGELKRGKFIYKTRNIVAPEKWIYLFSDVPHLIKTCRNRLLSSGSHIQFMWKDNQNIVWQHIECAFYQNLEDGCKLLPKLTQDHFNLTPYSKLLPSTPLKS